MNTKEIAKNLRDAYKKQGWSSRKISVKIDLYSMGSSINVEVKSPDVDIDKARAMAEGKEKVDYCELTHEILSGGNMFVHFRISKAVRDSAGAEYLERVKSAWALALKSHAEKEKSTSSAIFEITEKFGITCHASNELVVWAKDKNSPLHHRNYWNLEESMKGLAFQIARNS